MKIQQRPHPLSTLLLCLLCQPALAQSPRTGIALARIPGWENTMPGASPADSAARRPQNFKNAYIVAAAEQPDGALQVLTAVQAGQVYAWNTGSGGQQGLRLYSVRFRPDGRLDTAFSRGGWAECTIPNNTYIRNIRAALQPDGKWLAAFDFSYDKDVALLRFEPDGRLDTTFWKGGYVYFTNDPSKTDELLELSLLTDGKILLFMSSRYETLNHDCRVLRLHPDGMIDTTFDRDGVLTLAERPWVAACRMLPDGRFVLVSHHLDWLRVERYLPDGRPDTGYGRFGRAHTRIETINEDFLTLWPDGSLILQGNESTLCETGRPGSAVRARYFDAAGQPDTRPLFETTTFAGPEIHAIDDTTWMMLSHENTGEEVARFYNRGGVEKPHRLYFSGIFNTWRKQVVPSQPGGAFVLEGRDDMLAVARLLPNGRLHPAYGLDSAAIAALGYTIRTTGQAEKTRVELKETNPLPSPYNVTVTWVQNPAIYFTRITPWTFDSNVRTCHSLLYIDAPHLTGKKLHVRLQDHVFSSNGADWSAVPAERLLGLSLANCRFEGKMPAELRRFKHLEFLEIRYDSTLSDFQRHLDQALRLIPLFPNIKYLVIYAPGMTEAPKSLKKLRDVVSIDMNTPRLTRFPEAILRMKNLRELRLTFRCPDGLPAAIGRLDSLRILELTGAGPEARLQLPETLGRLQHLKELRLTDGALPATLPASAGALRQLEKLELVNAGITALPDSLGACARLTEITITSAGSFERLPERWGRLPDLTKLKVEVCNPAPYLRAQGERFRRQAAAQNRWFEIRLGEE